MIYAALEFSFRPRGKIPLAERGESVEHPSTNSTSLALLQVFAWASCAQVESHPSDVMTLSSARGLSLSRRLCHGEPVMCVCVCMLRDYMLGRDYHTLERDRWASSHKNGHFTRVDIDGETRSRVVLSHFHDHVLRTFDVTNVTPIC